MRQTKGIQLGDSRILLIEKALTKLCKIHNAVFTIIVNEQNHTVTFVIEEGEKKNEIE